MSYTTPTGLVLPNGTGRPHYPADPLPNWVQELRPQQVDAVREAVEHYRAGADVVFLDGPVGVGKTLIGELVRREREVEQAVYMCSDKALQDQFARDFPYARVLKGRRNYLTLKGPNDITTDDCTSEGWDDPCMWCDPMQDCPYTVAKQAAINAPIAVLNNSYFLHVANFTDAFRGNDLVIADEADLLEDSLLGFTEFEVPNWIGRTLGLEYPKKGVHKPTLIFWLETVARHAKEFVNSRSGDMLDVKDRRKILAFAAEAKVVAAQLQKDVDSKGSEDDDSDTDDGGRWIREYETRTLKLLPVMVAQYGTRHLWRHGRQWLLMSGTIISSDEMADTLGLPLDYATVSIASPFPVENRQVILAPVANVTFKATDIDYARLAIAIERIVEKHPGRVLVHCVSYKLTKILHDRVHLGSRVKVTYRNSYEKGAALRKYLRTKGAVMFAPSMDRGVDLKGDACECLIIAKCPFPNRSDRRISARMHLPGGQQWYAAKTVRDIVQMTGRGVRTPEDVCPTYVLDQQFTSNVWAKNKFLFPAYFREAVDARSDIRWLLR